ncbi:MAG: protein kinase [Anaerolineae bacterium]|nr:protein kinase [Anaerolineae bacterium]
MQNLIGTSLGHYTILELLGEGGMGSVYKAYDTATNREVAIKVLHPHLAQRPGFQERFLQEARIAKSLDHPGLVKTYDVGQEGAWLYLVMPFISGTNLRQMLIEMQRDGKRLALDKVVVFMHLLCQAVGYAHSRGVLHGDIKPSNVIIVAKPAENLPDYPVLADMGLARTLGVQDETQHEVSKGTPAYMALEVALGQKAGTYSDVYSLGALLYELVIGRPPFEVKTVAEAVRDHAQGAPPAPRTLRPDLPAALEALILKALAKDPSQRFADANAMAAALETASASVPKTTATVADTAAPLASLSQTGQALAASAATVPYKTPVDDSSDFPLPAGHMFPDKTPVDEGLEEETGTWLTLSLDPYILTVEPGDFVDVSVTLFNQGLNYDSLLLSVAGVPSSWVELSPTLRLAPGQQQTVIVSISPPDDPQSRAGQYTLTIRAVSQSSPTHSAEAQATLTVKAVPRFDSELHPARIYASRDGRIAVRNQGNAEETYTLQWTDPAGALEFIPPQRQLTVQSGETKHVEFRGKPHTRRWAGGETSYPFSVQIRATSGDIQTHTGELLSKGHGTVLALLLVVLLCLVPVLLWRLLPQEIQQSVQAALPLPIARETPMPTATATLVPAPTQEAVSPSPVPPSPTPVISAEEAIKDYYALVAQEQYTYAYPMVKVYDLHGKKQSQDEYVAGWTESGPAMITHVIDVQETGDTATITLELYYTQKGVSHTLRFELARNVELGDERFGYWLFIKGEWIN